MNLRKVLLFVVVIAAAAGIYFSGILNQFTPDYLKSLVQQSPLTAGAIYFGVYVMVAALSIPGALIITLMAGAVFGLFWGVVLVSFASSIGATLAFLFSKILLSSWVQRKFGRYVDKINQGVEREGAFYLFSLRLVPAVPFVVINLVFGLTSIKTRTFYWVSQLGMLAGTIVYVNAGASLSNIESFNAGDILTPGVIASFLILAVFPYIAKFVIHRVKQKKAMAGFNKPEKFDTNMVVIGAGSAGLVTSYIAAAVKAKVTLIEKHKMGGDCLNTGCVPSKTLIRSAKVKHTLDHADRYGIDATSGSVNFQSVFSRVHQAIDTIAPHDSVERYSSLGVDCVQGQAEIVSPYEVKVNGRVITTESIVIATGARPLVPPIEGLDQVPYLTSDSLWSLKEQPKRLLVVGGGPIGCELAQAFQRLGSQVTLVNQASRLMSKEDDDVSAFILERFVKEGIHVLLDHKLESFTKDTGEYSAIVRSDGQSQRIVFDQVLLAVGRKPNVEGIGLEALGINTTPQGTISVDEQLRTKFTNILACGDVAGPYQFTHTASHQAWYAAVNGLLGRFKTFAVDYRVIPWATFTDPEVARVGLSEQDAKDQSVDYELTRYDLGGLDRAIAEGQAEGFVKVITAKGSDRILGATIVGAHAGELIAEFVMAMKHKIGLNKLLGTIHIYPTWTEANKYVAGQWKRKNAPEKLLNLAAKYFNWRR